MHARNRSPSDIQMSAYQAHGFDVIHEHVVNVNPMGGAVEVDLSATDPDCVVRVAVKKAYEAGHRAGEAALQAKLRDILGVAKNFSSN